MHTVDLLDEALVVAGRLGYRLRQDWLGGSRGGGCEIRGQKWLFLDLALTPDEHLDQVIEALRGEQGLRAVAASAELGRLLEVRKSA